MRWAYGITTCGQRVCDWTLGRTLQSLKAAGFEKPGLFLDDPRYVHRIEEYRLAERSPKIGAFGNWVLGLWELLLREPDADRYAMFQDDVLASSNLRQYLEACEYPARGYWNLFTAPDNQKLISEKFPLIGFFGSDQLGRGAVALVFDRAAVVEVLRSFRTVSHAYDPYPANAAGKSIDGVVLNALQGAGYTEYVHNPSLVQHVGEVSTVGNERHAQAPNFRGEAFDCLSLLKPAQAAVRGPICHEDCGDGSTIYDDRPRPGA